jgi:DNA-binding MarR family transcriptional regulator
LNGRAPDTLDSVPSQQPATSEPPTGNHQSLRYGQHAGSGDDTLFFRLSYVIARLDRAIRRGLEERLAPHGLSVSQYTTLSVLRNRPGLSNAQLARRSFMTPQAMNEVIASLEDAKLIRREVDRNHRRILRARLTARGKRLFERLDDEIGELEEQMLAGLSPAARRQFSEAAVHCVHTLGAGLPDS